MTTPVNIFETVRTHARRLVAEATPAVARARAAVASRLPARRRRTAADLDAIAEFAYTVNGAVTR